MRLVNWDGLRHTNDDMRRKFNSTFIHGMCPNLSTEIRTYHLNDFDGGLVRASAFSNRTNKLINPATENWADIDVLYAFPPQTGVIPFGKDILYLTRNPARQWQVGLCRNNSHVYGSTLKPLPLVSEHAEAMFTAKYPRSTSLDEALEKFKDKELIAYALNHRYWLSRPKGSSTISLLRNLIPLGSCSHGSFFIHKACGDFKQELLDDLKIKVK